MGSGKSRSGHDRIGTPFGQAQTNGINLVSIPIPFFSNQINILMIEVVYLTISIF